MDATTLGGIFSGIAVLLSTLSGIQLTRSKAQKTRLEALERGSERDAQAVADLDAWQYQARHYFARLFNFFADAGLEPPEPPPELGLRLRGTLMTAGEPPPGPRHMRADP
jgi:hypothetical protein